MKRAEELSYPHTQVFTICHAHALIDIFQRRLEDMRFVADSVVSLSREHGLSHWMAFGGILEGWAVAIGGEADQGIKLLRAGVAAWQKAGARLWLPMFHALEAEAYSKGGRSDKALVAIEQAITIAQSSDVKPDKDKLSRLISQIDLFEGGSILLPKDAPWLDEFVHELLSFPGRHDDQVDALSQGLAWQRQAWKPPAPRRTFGMGG